MVLDWRVDAVCSVGGWVFFPGWSRVEIALCASGGEMKSR